MDRREKEELRRFQMEEIEKASVQVDEELRLGEERERLQHVEKLQEGAAKAQQIIRETLSDSYLQYLWIRTLNENPNVIYVATEANLPIFKGVEGAKR